MHGCMGKCLMNLVAVCIIWCRYRKKEQIRFNFLCTLSRNARKHLIGFIKEQQAYRHQAQSVDTTQGLCITGSIVPSVNNIRLFGVTVDNHLSFDVVRSCKYRSLRHTRPLIDCETVVNLACSIVASRLDYCNSVLYGVSETNIAKLQRMHNNLARVVCKQWCSPRDSCLASRQSRVRLLKYLASVSKSKSLASPRLASVSMSKCLGLASVSRLASLESILLFGLILVLYFI